MKCPCCSGKSYLECCEPLHKGEAAATPLALMRSRYSAYALHLPDYIVETMDNPPSRQELEAVFANTIFESLTIVNHDEATVTFIAKFRGGGFQEKSLFKKINGRWRYQRALELKEII